MVRARAPPNGRTISRFVPSVWVTLMMTPYTYCSGEKDLKRAFLCTVGASIDLLSSALNPLIIIWMLNITSRSLTDIHYGHPLRYMSVP